MAKKRPYIPAWLSKYVPCEGKLKNGGVCNTWARHTVKAGNFCNKCVPGGVRKDWKV